MIVMTRGLVLSLYEGGSYMTPEISAFLVIRRKGYSQPKEDHAVSVYQTRGCVYMQTISGYAMERDMCYVGRNIASGAFESISFGKGRGAEERGVL